METKVLPVLNGHVYTKTLLDECFRRLCAFFREPCGAKGCLRRNSECQSRHPEKTFVWIYIIMTIGDESFLWFTGRCYSVLLPSTFSHIQWD